jgi:ketosteroid isomerase-like protein
MSESNVELVRQGFEALNEGGVEALMPLIHPEFEVTTPPGLAAEPDTYRGPDGVRRYFDSFYEAMDKIEFKPERFITVGDRVVVPMTLRARGRTTGIETEQEIVQVWDVEDGQAIRVSVHATIEEAMERAGETTPAPSESSADDGA